MRLDKLAVQKIALFRRAVDIVHADAYPRTDAYFPQALYPHCAVVEPRGIEVAVHFRAPCNGVFTLVRYFARGEPEAIFIYRIVRAPARIPAHACIEADEKIRDIRFFISVDKRIYIVGGDIVFSRAHPLKNEMIRVFIEKNVLFHIRLRFRQVDFCF